MAIAAATATAQAWTILDALLDYGDERLMFEMIPMRVSQAANASPRRAEVQLRLRQLPAALFSESNAEPFLLRLREHLSLSIPERNLIVTSTGFRLETHDAQQRSLEVSYLFNADLEEFSHVELILAQPGNPIFVPVPVE